MNSPEKPLNCWSIPAGQPFLSVLAGWLLGEYGADMATLTRALVLLPNRRACRALREAFLALTDGKPLLLPRIQPIGEMDEETLFTQTFHDIPPAIAPLRRELLLTRMVIGFGKKQYNVEQAAELARQLARFIDDAAREGISFDQLATLVPEELAAHWQETLDFLTLISRHWPDIIAGEGALDPAQHRNLILRATADAWRSNPPPYPIIAAGSTGSIPATAHLLSTIARLPQGRVILPGLDTQLPESEWELVTETHPQFALKQLLGAMDCKRSEIGALKPSASGKWLGEGVHPGLLPEGEGEERLTSLRAILQPADATARWPQLAVNLADGLRDVKLLTADTQLDEARMIAIALRETLETSAKTAALITPDRSLARMVAAQMERFGVTVDDSAGEPLADTPTGCFLRLVLDVAASKAAPSPLLALLRHPLAAAGMEPAECRKLSRQLETKLLRGIRRAPGLQPLHDAASSMPHLQKLLANLIAMMRPLTECFAQNSVPLSQLLTAHAACAEALAGSDRLWDGDSGNSMAEFFAGLLPHAEILDGIDPTSYPGLFEVLLAPQTYRPRYGSHPRLHILSPIEARLQHYDRVILGGLNEGAWPAQPPADPWMSRPMRGSFGLPSPERAIGQSAHDIFLLAASPEVLLTRSRKVEGTPTVPSRWLMRLETLVKGLDASAFAQMDATAYYEEAKTLLDAPLPLPPARRPEPCPPVDARPRQLRVTAIDTWLRDPYMIYARYILNLRKLDAIDKEPDAADFGTLVHKALEDFTASHPDTLPANPMGVLLDYGREAFAPMLDRPAVACMWWPRFEAMAGWIVEQETDRRGGLSKVVGELKGTWEFTEGDKPFTLTTRIDRIEIARDGSLVIADYKTGFVPSPKDIERGLANQLLLEALILQYGRLEPPIPHDGIIAGLEYWKLAGNVEHSEIVKVKPELIESAGERLMALIHRFDHRAMPYAPPGDPSLTPVYNDYAHLTRRQEWEMV